MVVSLAPRADEADTFLAVMADSNLHVRVAPLVLAVVGDGHAPPARR